MDPAVHELALILDRMPAEERLRLHFGTRVRIVRQGTKGRIEIDFGSEDELIRLFDQLTGE